MNYWFYLDPYTYSVVKKDCVLLYNTINGEYVIENNSSSIIDIFHSMACGENYCVSLSEANRKSDDFNRIIRKIQLKSMGDLIEVSDNVEEVAPFVFPFLLDFKLQNGHIDKLSYLREKTDVASLVNEISFFTGTDVESRMGVSPYFFKREVALDTRFITICELVLNKLPRKQVITINLPGAALAKTDVNKGLLSSILIDNLEIILIFHYCEVISDDFLEEALKNKWVIYVDTDFYSHISEFEYWIAMIRRNALKCKLCFLVSGVEILDFVENMVDQYEITIYQIVPICLEENRDFIVENVFLTQDDILSVPMSKQRIFSNQVVNSNDFGHLNIFSNGTVYANLYFEKLGNILIEELADLVYKEAVGGNSWYRIRREEPCSSCVFQWLCPSPSNYELVIDKPNLCHVKV